MRRSVRSLLVLILTLIALVCLPSGKPQAQEENYCLNKWDNGNPCAWDATTPEGRQILYPSDACKCALKEVYYTNDYELFRPVWNTDVYWGFEELESTQSRFQIDKDTQRMICYDEDEDTQDCLSTPAARGGRFVAEPNAAYELKRYAVGGDSWPLRNPFGRVSYWEGQELDPRDDVCPDAQTIGGSAPGFLEFGGDQDWYLINVSAPGVLDVRLQVPAMKNYDLELWADCSTMLGRADNPNNTPERITKFVTPGSYRLHIYGATAGDSSNTQYYSISSSLTPDSTAPTCSEPVYDPGTNPVDSTPYRCCVAPETPTGDPGSCFMPPNCDWPSVTFTLQDSGSGLAGGWPFIRYLLDNISFWAPDIPRGTTQPVTIEFWKNDLDRSSRVVLWVQDMAGNTLGGEADPLACASDATPPICWWAGTGDPKVGYYTVQDEGSGLAQIAVLSVTNVTLDPAPRSDTTIPVPVGSTAEFLVTETIIDPEAYANSRLEITDVMGNRTICDPVQFLVIREKGEPETATFTELTQEMRYITIKNGAPGLKNVKVEVNGQQFTEAGLKDGEEVRLDVASAMVVGAHNQIAVTGYGKPGGGAMIIIADVP